MLKMMSSHLPPLTALRAFEAAARYLSIKKAAEELHVTPAAVGHQIKVLESYVGTQLFRRLNRGLRLTNAGEACLPQLRDGFALLSRGVERAMARDHRPRLVVSVAPVLAVKWLVPRLDRFLEAQPDLELRIETTTRVVDLEREEIDIGVRFSPGASPGIRADLLFHENVSPVCSPALCRGPRAIRKPTDLRWHTLIHVMGETQDRTWPSWPGWLESAGSTEVDGRSGPRFNQTGTAVQAAVEKQGVALVGYVCIADELASGQLVRPFGDSFRVQTEFAYYVVFADSRDHRPEVESFRSWLIEEADSDPSRRSTRPRARTD